MNRCEHGKDSDFGCSACFYGWERRGAEQERAAIVAYLRETCIITVRVGSPEAIAADIIANRIEAIERGKHRK